LLSFVRNEAGERKVMLRVLGDGTGKEEILVSGGLKDPYYAVLAVDRRDTIWMFFTALAESGNYDVFARHYSNEGGLSDPVNLTESGDDAMHPDAAVDGSGNVWVTYYRWQKMGFHSRDKEIFARFFDGEAWSEEMRLSPRDLPDYEDHTDPSIAPAPDGGVCVAWSWDMHPLQDDRYRRYRRYQTRFRAEAPTIFGCGASADSGEGDLYFFGEASIDNAPELHAAAGGTLWCAFNALEPGYTKSLYASSCAPQTFDRGEQYAVERGVLDLCTPRFIEAKGELAMVWSSQDFEGAWSLKKSVYENGKWSGPEIIEERGDPRFPAAACAKDGTPWLAFTEETGRGRRIILRKLGFRGG
jgi:hypothetical protein